MSRNILLLLMILVSLFGMLGCLSLSLAPAPPSVQGDVVQTIIAATAGAAATQTAAFKPSPTRLPSPTPTATLTPTITPTPTPIILFPTFTPFVLSSPGGGGGGGGGGTTADFDCVILDQTPPDGTVIMPRRDFDTFWTVRNSGTRTWDHGSVDFIYLRGDRIHEVAGYDLPRDVAPGRSIQLGVDMVAPGTQGTYTTVWGLRVGHDIFCELSLTIVVRP